MAAETILIANLLVLAITVGVLAIVVKLYIEILKDRKFDVREQRSGPSVPGTPGHDGDRSLTDEAIARAVGRRPGRP